MFDCLARLDTERDMENLKKAIRLCANDQDGKGNPGIPGLEFKFEIHMGISYGYVPSLGMKPLLFVIARNEARNDYEACNLLIEAGAKVGCTEVMMADAWERHDLKIQLMSHAFVTA